MPDDRVVVREKLLLKSSPVKPVLDQSAGAVKTSVNVSSNVEKTG